MTDPRTDTGVPAAAPAEEPGRSPLRRPAVRLALLVLALVVALLLTLWLVRYETRGKYVQGTNDAYIRADAVTVSPKVSGYVDQLFVTDNQRVRAGQPLLRIDARDYRAQAAQSQAQIDAATAAAQTARADILEQEAAVTQARAQLATAQANARYAAGEVARYAPLAESGADTRERLAMLANQAEQARNQAAGARAALLIAQRRAGSLRAQIGQSRAQGEAARAQLAAANVNLGSTLLRASVDGRIGDRTVRVGQFVLAGTRLMSVVPLAIYVEANFKETQIGLMRIGQPATIEADALPGVDLRGRVESISPGTGSVFSILPPQNATGNFTKVVQRVPVRIAIDAGPEARAVLVSGLSVAVKVDTIGARGGRRSIADEEEARRRQGR